MQYSDNFFHYSQRRMRICNVLPSLTGHFLLFIVISISNFLDFLHSHILIVSYKIIYGRIWCNYISTSYGKSQVHITIFKLGNYWWPHANLKFTLLIPACILPFPSFRLHQTWLICSWCWIRVRLFDCRVCINGNATKTLSILTSC